jgi:hypothetical protein
MDTDPRFNTEGAEDTEDTEKNVKFRILRFEKGTR